MQELKDYVDGKEEEKKCEGVKGGTDHLFQLPSKLSKASKNPSTTTSRRYTMYEV